MSRRSAHVAGFTLIEMVCVMAMLAVVAAILLPRIPHETTPARLEAYALQLASLLKQDRNSAMLRRAEVSTAIDAGARIVRSGATGHSLVLPADVMFGALLPERCAGRRAFSTISFFANGMSCGGAVALSREGNRIEIRVNWLTGEIELVPTQPT